MLDIRTNLDYAGVHLIKTCLSFISFVNIYMHPIVFRLNNMVSYCQAQLQLESSVPVQLGTEISLNISVTPNPPGQVYLSHF